MRRPVAIACSAAAATLVYLIGLIAPLTPSAGMPRPWALVVFLAVPCGLLAGCVYAARSRLVKAVLALQLLAFGGFGAWLLYLQAATR